MNFVKLVQLTLILNRGHIMSNNTVISQSRKIHLNTEVQKTLRRKKILQIRQQRKQAQKLTRQKKKRKAQENETQLTQKRIITFR